MDYQEAINVLNGNEPDINRVVIARAVAVGAMQELQDIKSQMDNNLKIYISELRQAKHDIETFWEEPTALSKALQNAIRALVEIQNYKQLGTLDEVKSKIGAFEQVRYERDVALEQLKEIGCEFGQKMDEVKSAVEKQEAKKVKRREVIRDFYGSSCTIKGGDCPTCGAIGIMSTKTNYCHACGQKLDWSVNE